MKSLKVQAIQAGCVLTQDRDGFYHLYDVKIGCDVLITRIRQSVVSYLKGNKVVETYSPACGAW